MTSKIITINNQVKEHKKLSVTCLTCSLKKCVGRCRWETVECLQQPKGKVA